MKIKYIIFYAHAHKGTLLLPRAFWKVRRPLVRFREAVGMDPKQLKQLRDFVSLCKSKPEIIHMPQLSFFKEWLLRLSS